MTAINDLITIAGETALASQELALPFNVLADVETTMRKLYGSIFDALEGMIGLRPMFIPYAAPTGPIEPKESPPAKEAEKKPVTLGQIDIRTLITDLQRALDREIPVHSDARSPGTAGALPMGKDRPIRKTLSSSVTTKTFNVYSVTKEIQKHMESLEKETISLPGVYSDFYSNVSDRKPDIADRPFAADYARASSLISPGNEVKAVEKTDNKHTTDTGHITRSYPGTIARKPMKQRSSPVDEGIRRSTTAVKALETVYENIVKNSVNVESIDRELRSSSVGQINVASEPMGMPPTAEKRRQSHSPDIIFQSSLAHPASQATAKQATVKDFEHVNVAGRDKVKKIEVPTLKLTSYVPTPAAQAEDNAKNLSAAFSRSVSTPRLHAEDVNVKKSTKITNTSIPASPLSALTSVYNSFSVMGSYMGAVADMARPIGIMSDPGTRSPVVNMALDRAVGKPDSGPSPISALIRIGSSMPAPIPEILRRATMSDAGGMRLPSVEMLGRGAGIEGHRSPAVNFAVNLAASNELQRAGGPVIREFIRSGPSISSGLGGAASAVAAERNSIINIASPAAAGNTTDNSTVSKVSNFHNTFNITISTKGGGEEGNLRDLGKKIGKILSDEMKRYGGI